MEVVDNQLRVGLVCIMHFFLSGFSVNVKFEKASYFLDFLFHFLRNLPISENLFENFPISEFFRFIEKFSVAIISLPQALNAQLRLFSEGKENKGL